MGTTSFKKNITGSLTGGLEPIEIKTGKGLWREAFKRLKRDKLAIVGAIIIIFLVIVAILADLISPFNPDKQYKNGTAVGGRPFPINSVSKNVLISFNKPVLKEIIIPDKTLFVTKDKKGLFQTSEKTVISPGTMKIEIPVSPLNIDMLRIPQGTSLSPIEIEIKNSQIGKPIFIYKDIKFPEIDNMNITLKNDKYFLLGTEPTYGRDIFSRLIYGARISLQVGIIAMGIATIIGMILGLMSGFFGGWIDIIIMRVTDIMMSFPDLLLVMAIVAIRGPSLGIIFIAIGLVSWTSIARIVRSQVLSVKEMEFVEASKSYGASNNLIIFKHILPNVLAPVIVIATMGIAGAIMTEAALSFLGFGVKVPTASWGSMINSGLGYFRDAPWVPLIPGISIAVTVFAFNLFGDGLRDALDPRLK